MKTNKTLFSRLTGPTKTIISLKKPSNSLFLTSTNNIKQVGNKNNNFDTRNLNELSKENSYNKTKNKKKQ